MKDWGISFSHPENAGLFVGWIMVVFFIMRTHRFRQKAWKLLGLQLKESDFEAPRLRPLKNALLILGLFWLCVAAVGPQWGQKTHPVKAQGLDICFALDLSKSMLTEDLAPNRLDQAKHQLEIFLPRLGGDRAALVGFAGSGYVAAPLSVDHQALVAYLDPMLPDIISDQATSLSAGVEACLSALGLDEVTDPQQILDDAARLIVLISDGEDNADDAHSALTRAEKLGVPVFGMAMGTEKGGPIPLRDNGRLLDYVKDPETRQPVLSKLEIKGLKDIAAKTGGKVFYGSAGLEAWKEFENAISDYKRESRDAGTKLDKEERFQWPLAIAFALLLVEFFLPETQIRWRLGLLIGCMLPLGMLAGNPAAAASPLKSNSMGTVWWNNQGVEAFQKKDLKKADEEFGKALMDDAADPVVRFNWATNKIFGAADPQHPGQVDKEQLKGAVQELEKLQKEKLDPRLKPQVDYQLGQAYEALGENTSALESYYRAAEGSSAASPQPQAELEKMARTNILRLLNAPPQQQQQQGGGEGQDNSQKDEKDSQNGQGKEGEKPQNPQYSKGQAPKPKFSGTDVSEAEARQILESVSGEEKEVLKRKAKGESKEQGRRRRKEMRESGDTGRSKAW